jgi:hypothetical protein
MMRQHSRLHFLPFPGRQRPNRHAATRAKYSRKTLAAVVKLLALSTAATLLCAGCHASQPATTVSKAAPVDIFSSDSDIPAHVGAGWYQLQNDSGSNYRWAGQQSQLIIEPPASTRARIVLYLSSFQKTRRCNVAMNGKVVAIRDIPDKQAAKLEFVADLLPGHNVMTVSSPDRSDAPADVPDLSSSDERSLSFVFWSVSITKTAWSPAAREGPGSMNALLQIATGKMTRRVHRTPSLERKGMLP